MVKPIPQWTHRAALMCAKVLGKIIGRPSESLLAELAGKDRPGPVATPDSPFLAASGHIQLGRTAFDAGDYGEALHCFSEAIRLAPEAPWGWHGRGDALQLSGQPTAALNAYERACELAPDVGIHHAGRANSLGAIGRESEADLAWNSALDLDPSLAWMREGSKER